jgi:putative cardiolipin synthase
VKITILTNPLEAIDVPAVHAALRQTTQPLLEAGMVLFEMKRAFAVAAAKKRGRKGSSSATSWHAKFLPLIAHACSLVRSISIRVPHD